MADPSTWSYVTVEVAEGPRPSDWSFVTVRLRPPHLPVIVATGEDASGDRLIPVAIWDGETLRV
jgi:hypothetical protein